MAALPAADRSPQRTPIETASARIDPVHSSTASFSGLQLSWGRLVELHRLHSCSLAKHTQAAKPSPYWAAAITDVPKAGQPASQRPAPTDRQPSPSLAAWNAIDQWVVGVLRSEVRRGLLQMRTDRPWLRGGRFA